MADLKVRLGIIIITTRTTITAVRHIKGQMVEYTEMKHHITKKEGIPFRKIIKNKCVLNMNIIQEQHQQNIKRPSARWRRGRK